MAPAPITRLSDNPTFRTPPPGRFVCLPFYVGIERALPDALSAETISRLEANIDAWATYAIEEVVAVGAPAAALPPPPPATPPPPRATTPDLNA